MNNILITGGAGFVGANLALDLKANFPHTHVYVLDNLSRSGSELNVLRLKNAGINFHQGDVRNMSDLNRFTEIDVILHTAAEPSVMAGIKKDPKNLIDINFCGTINCLELAKKWKSTFVYLSTNRIYSYPALNRLEFIENKSRFEFSTNNKYYQQGINEDFDTSGLKSLYGASKFASEHLIREYAHHFNFTAIINRFGVIAGPWQMGKVDQGFVALWVASHYFGRNLKYLGFGGKGKQVRDVLHIDDVARLIVSQLENQPESGTHFYNVGGGWKYSTSLKELTEITAQIVGKKINIGQSAETRPVDIRIYYTDHSKVSQDFNWHPRKKVTNCVEDTFQWIRSHEEVVAKIFNP